ncbi:MAG: ClbS/DfsB family four-helix bundle protein [Oscillospiraceae bacterium]|jgi:hypothetical protein|nr:ClbS/DfsB family four-helix bundle protein [Oscillospiraceae bacterium]
MGRPATKADLIKAANEQFEKMWGLMGVMTDDERHASFDFGDHFNKREAHWQRDKNLRDVLVHLYEWHRLLLHWVEANQAGDTKPFLPQPYNWKTYAQMNAAFWQKHQSTPHEEAERMLRGSHQKVMALIERFSNENLFESRRFAWTGTSSLGAYCVSATSSHYDWAMKKIKAHIKAYGQSV